MSGRRENGHNGSRAVERKSCERLLLLLLLSWRLRRKLGLGVGRQGREDEPHRWVLPGYKGVREGERVEGDGCGSRGGGGPVARFGAGLGGRGTGPEPCGVGRRRQRELVSGGRRARGRRRGRGRRAKGAYECHEGQIFVVWRKAAAPSVLAQSLATRTG